MIGLALVGGTRTAHEDVLKGLDKVEGYTFLHIDNNVTGMDESVRYGRLNRILRNRVRPFEIVIVSGITTAEEVTLCRELGLLAALLPGTLPRFLLSGLMAIDKKWLYVSPRPHLLAKHKQRIFMSPLEAVSEVIIRNRRGTPRMNGRTPSKKEALYIKACIAIVGCIACRIEGYEVENPEVWTSFHHDPDFGSRQPGCHYHGFGLCAAHHQGTGQRQRHPARHVNESRFIQAYGTDAELCAETWKLIPTEIIDEIGFRLGIGELAPIEK